MPGPAIDVVTVFHNETNKAQARQLGRDLALQENAGTFTFNPVDNTSNNRGFAPGCNLGAARGTAPIIGFLNPDGTIHGSIVSTVVEVFEREGDDLVITGERFGKNSRELRAWGVRDWVCGACLFVRRDWFETVGGFDEAYLWGWEETDLIRTAQADGKRVMSIRLPYKHSSPGWNSEEDAQFKNRYFDAGAAHFRRKWPRVRHATGKTFI